MATRKEGNKNQIVTNIHYDQNTLSTFWKPLITKSKWHQIKFILRRLTGTFWNKIWDFSSMRLGKCWLEMSKSGRSLLKHCFFKKVLNMNGLETLRNKWNLREFFILQERRIEVFHYPGYVIRLQKERQIQAKTKNLHQNWCTKTKSPQSNKYWAENKKKCLHFLQVTTFQHL